MTFKLGIKTPPPGAPKKVKLKFAGEIRNMITEAKKLFAIKQLPNGYEFDYRVWISEYDETHINALIKGNNFDLGELIHDSDGYCKFVLATRIPDATELGVEELVIFAANQFHQLWQSIDLGCKVPSNLEVWVYE